MPGFDAEAKPREGARRRQFSVPSRSAILAMDGCQFWTFGKRARAARFVLTILPSVYLGVKSELSWCQKKSELSFFIYVVQARIGNGFWVCMYVKCFFFPTLVI